jgi:L-proline amide hydrolase
MLDFRDWQTWYRVTGDLASATKTPVVVLHGGPGATHNLGLSPDDPSLRSL